VDVGDRTGCNAPAAPQAIARGRLPKPTIAATMNARITWMRPEGRRLALYMRGGPVAQQPSEGRRLGCIVSHNNASKELETDKEGAN
jgi:hypothetical protein